MTNETLELILEQHDIHPTFWPEMKALVFDHVRPSKRTAHTAAPRRQLQGRLRRRSWTNCRSRSSTSSRRSATNLWRCRRDSPTRFHRPDH